jgi:hypothetical protein
MNSFDPEKQAELHRQRILEEVQQIHLENEAIKGKNTLSRVLARVGAWMMARGEKMLQKNSTPQMLYSQGHKKIAHR